VGDELVATFGADGSKGQRGVPVPQRGAALAGMHAGVGGDGGAAAGRAGAPLHESTSPTPDHPLLPRRVVSDTRARFEAMPYIALVILGAIDAATDAATRYLDYFGGPRVPVDTNSVWWQWTAGRTRSVTISTGLSRNRAGRGLDTMLAVYRGRAPNRNLCQARRYISQVAWDDNSGPGRTSRVQFRAVRGRHDYILVDGAPRWQCSPNPCLPSGEEVCSVDGRRGDVRVRLSNP